MDIREATRKPFPVKVVQVTLANIHEVAEWCKGIVEQRPHRLGGTITMLPVIILNAQPKKFGEQQTEAGLGYWIVEMKNNFRAYKDAQFQSAFDLLPVPSLVAATDELERDNARMLLESAVDQALSGEDDFVPNGGSFPRSTR